MQQMEADRRWDAVLFQRRSTRTYIPTPLEREQADALARLMPELLGPARVRHLLVEGAEAADAIFRGAVGSYGKVIGAPALLLFIGQTRSEPLRATRSEPLRATRSEPLRATVVAESSLSPGCERRLDGAPGFMAGVGYLGEQLVLEATALGLATCWVGGFFRREVARKYADLGPGEEVVAVSPVGLPALTSGLRALHDRTMKLFTPGRGQRKALADIVRGDVSEPWLKEALEAARWAPSSVNLQPWRFAVDGGGITISHEGPSRAQLPWGEDPRTLDLGIAMLHFAVAAGARGHFGRWAQVARAATAPACWRWEEA